MRKVSIAVFLFVAAVSVQVSADGLFRSTEIWASISLGRLQSGFQRDLPSQTLSPSPEWYAALMPMLGIRTYFAGPLGLEAAFGLFGSTQGEHGGYDPVKVYDFNVISLGPILRYIFRTGGGVSTFALFAGGGVNYSFITLSNSYTSLFSGFSFYDVLPDFGWYAKGGIAWYLTPGVFFDTTLEYSTMNAKFDVSGKALDGVYILLAFSAGFAF